MELQKFKDALVAEINHSLTRNKRTIDQFTDGVAMLKGLTAATDQDTLLDFYTGLGDELGDNNILIRLPFSVIGESK